MAILEALETTYDPWPLRRQRTQELRERYTFAGQVLNLYAGLLEVQAAAFHNARLQAPAPPELPDYIAERVLPEVVDATVQSGPALLVEGVTMRFASQEPRALIHDWLRGERQTPVETYLARAAATPVLEAMGTAAGIACEQPRDERHCPSCGGLPQLSYFAVSGEALVTGPRYLVCSRCSHNWTFTRMVCAGCGETSSQRLPIYGEGERFPHIRIDGCETCHRYLLTFDLRRDGRAVPIVDELAALPLDLYAHEHGLTKIIPNLMGN